MEAGALRREAGPLGGPGLGERVRALATPASATTAFTVAAPVVALAVWVLSVRGIDPQRMNDLGIVSILPPAAFAALALLTVSFAVALARRPLRGHILLLHVLALIPMLYGLPAMFEEEARFAVTYRHAGVTEHVIRTGDVDPSIDAYFNWPGFFTLLALVTDLTAVDSALAFGAWAPVGFNLLYLPALYLLLSAAGPDRRVAWLGIWIFYAANWVGQDYLSPQAFGYFLFLAVAAIVVRWLSLPRPRVTEEPAERRWLARLEAAARAALPFTREAEPGAGVSAHQRAALLLIAVALFAATVPAHQLTPFAVLSGVAVLALVGRLSARGLPVLMGVLVLTWMAYMTVAFLQGHIGELLGAIGELNSIVSANVSDRLKGSEQHVIVAYARLALSVAVWGLAALGALRRRRRRETVVPYLALGAGPFVLLGLQPYGGEMILRAFLFSLPFAALFAASLVVPPTPRTRRLLAPAVAVGSLLLLGGFLVTRYGNERADYFTHEEVAAARALYDAAPPGSQLVAVAEFAWKHRDYERYQHRLVLNLPQWKALIEAERQARALDQQQTPAARAADMRAIVQGIQRLERDRGQAQYVVLSRSQAASVDLLGTGPPGSVHDLEVALRRSRGFELVYENPDAVVFRSRLAPRKERA